MCFCVLALEKHSSWGASDEHARCCRLNIVIGKNESLASFFFLWFEERKCRFFSGCAQSRRQVSLSSLDCCCYGELLQIDGRVLALRHTRALAWRTAYSSRLHGLKVEETGVCKVVRERAYSTAWHPSGDKLLLAVGDKVVTNVNSGRQGNALISLVVGDKVV